MKKAQKEKVKYVLSVPFEARLKYEELFKNFVHEKLYKIREQLEKQLKKKKFIIKIGFE